jgi:hypothetical protein
MTSIPEFCEGSLNATAGRRTNNLASRMFPDERLQAAEHFRNWRHLRDVHAGIRNCVDRKNCFSAGG